MLRSAALAASLLVAPALAGAEVQTKEVTYKQGDTELQGFLAWDAAAKGRQPGVLVVHEWWGHNQHARNQAIRLAKSGYVGFALDMYGKGKLATHPQADFLIVPSENGVLSRICSAELAEFATSETPRLDRYRAG